LQSSYLINDKLAKDNHLIHDICLLYEALPDKNKKREIIRFLSYNFKSAFQSQIYYVAVISEIYKPEKRMTEKYEVEMISVASRGRTPRLFDEGFYTDHRLDEFINFSFRFQRPFSSLLLEQMVKLDDYYSWITDLESFDYINFNSDWLFV